VAKNRKQDLDTLAKDLSRLTHEEIAARIAGLDTDDLIQLLNAKSRKVGDSAFGCLAERPDGEHAVIGAIMQDRLTHRDAKVRGANFLEFRGRSTAEAVQAYFHLLDDKNAEVASNALFGLVFSQDRAYLERLRQKHESLRPDVPLKGELAVAIEAIESANPFLISSGYSPEQAEELWGIQDAEEKSRAAAAIRERGKQ
jgi:hypothetical protein